MFALSIALLGAWMQAAAPADPVGDVSRSLAALAALTREDGARLTVAVFPLMQPLAAWTPGERRNHEAALRILADLDIRAVDLLPALEEALAQGVEVQERPGDLWHPSPAAARVFAQHLVREGIFAARDPSAVPTSAAVR